MASGNTLAKWDAIGPLSMSENSIVGDLAIMLAEGCLLFIILCIWPPRFLRKSFLRSPPTASRVTGADVARERAVVERVCAGGILADYALVVKDVSRFFGSFAAVRGVSLAVRPGECLGLLGVSGSGKTALLNMIAGITPLSSGNCYSSVGDILGDLGKWQSNIGVCPYPGGFTESMHARGFLRLVGRLRGIPAWRLADSVESMISLFDLEALADIPYQAYTMEDCEMSCDHVAVMTRGEISCIGPLADLKKRFAKGYTVQFVLQRATSEEIEAFKSTVAAILPELKLREVPMHTLEYYADNKIQWPEWFEKTARLSEKFVLEHVYMSDTISTQIIVVIVQPRFHSITTESGVVSEQV